VDESFADVLTRNGYKDGRKVCKFLQNRVTETSENRIGLRKKY